MALRPVRLSGLALEPIAGCAWNEQGRSRSAQFFGAIQSARMEVSMTTTARRLSDIRADLSLIDGRLERLAHEDSDSLLVRNEIGALSAARTNLEKELAELAEEERCRPK